MKASVNPSGFCSIDVAINGAALTRVERPVLTHTKRPAFTLVELLVVIGVIALLIAILLPALAAAKEQARRVACGSNLHQIYLAAMMYTHDNNGWLPAPGKANPTLGPGNTGPNDISNPNWTWGNGFCIENLVSNNFWGVPDNPNGWWLLMEKPRNRYLTRDATRCPSMTPFVWNAWNGSPAAMEPLGPGSYVIDYDYRFNNCDSSYYFINDAASQYRKGMLTKAPYAALFHDGAGYRLGPSANRITPNTGTDITYGVDQFQWAHKIGGNVVRFDGAVMWVPNKIDLTAGSFYGNALSWPSGGAVIFYNYYGYGLDETMRQLK